MDKNVSVRDVDLECIGSVSTSRSKSSTATIFPPILHSQTTSPEAHNLEEPTLCKKIVHVHRKASEKQQKLDAAWLNTEGSGETRNCPIHSNPDNCSRLVDSLWEHGNEDKYKRATMTGLPSFGSAVHFTKQKLSIFAQQWRDGVSSGSKWTIIEACVRITCSNWVWCLVLGTWLEQKTAQKWGPVETVLANAICGCLFELFGGQAILIVGPSSPSLIFIVAITTTAKRLGVDAIPWMGWIGVWGSLVLLLLALFCSLLTMACDYSFLHGAVVGEYTEMERLQTTNTSRICRLQPHSCPNTPHSCSTLAKVEPHPHFTVIPGIMLAGILFIYHHATSGLLQDDVSWTPLYKNSKKWDLCIVALLVFLCSIFGLPYACGMLYQSQVHVRALTLKLHDYSDIEDRRGVVTKVRVQRVSGLGASLLSAAFLLPPVRHIITRIPLAILTGLLMQFTCHLYGRWDIIVLISRFFNNRTQAKSHRRPSKSALCVYTVAQIICMSIVMIVSKTPAAVMFPFFILVTLWVRHSAMRSLFRREDFAKLDTRLHKDCSDMSSSGQLSVASHVHARGQQAWPKISIPQTLNFKAAIAVPMTEVHTTQQQNPACVDGIQADIVAESGESPLPYAMSPSLLHASSRRLKERSRRRYKRKRQLSIDNADTLSSEQQHDEHTPIPPLVKAMMQEHNYPSLYEQDEDINLSKRVSPRLSPQFFRKSKHGPGGQEKPLEVHSNLLYEPKRPARKAMTQNEEPSTSNIAGNEIQSASQREEIARFQGSPGIGRCIRSPPVFKNQSPTIKIYKKKHLKISIAIPRNRAFPKEEIYPGNVGAQDPPRKPYPRLRRCSTSRWPTTHNDSLHHHHERQRHSTSMSKEERVREI
ncbi:hypothetical protein GOP47_0022811 [Adiantum capillus-veneris]|uniref:Bicarbonate transporter-like transmembrane domain-containing protein n=1 Tax=Adiantum capillus-veneris TaxID=13818 RepID=A0A9D4Z6C4_ADICA|nr:hypothetical protein GOP47_0022811 [Adiantum capillus-veneris]